MAHYVIVGNGVAAVGCIEGIRKYDRESPIVVISEENHPVYCRPLISYYLEGKTDRERMNYRPADFYTANGCDVRYGVRAEHIDPAAKTVALSDGSSVGYTSLCIATGSSPFVPPFAGLDTVAKKTSFLTMDDMLALEAAIDPSSRVLIVGAGLIGLKCAEGLHGRVASITVCDLADRVLSSILDPDCAATVQQHLEANGIEFLLADSAERFEGQTAQMRSGKRVAFDVLVLAVGVRANTGLIRELGGEVGRGIVVDERMATSLSGIYAAGDCTEGMDLSWGGRRVLALLPNATLQGRCAGANMAGGDEEFRKAIPMNSIGFFGLHIMTAGSYFTPEQGGEVFEERGEGTLRKLYTRNGLLTGFILIGATERAGIYTAMIREQTPLDTVDFERLKHSATTAAFSLEKRRKMFGGVV